MKKLVYGAALVGLFGAPVLADEMVLTSEVAASHWKTSYMERFVDEVEEATDGELTVSMFPAGQLYNDKDALGALGTGAVQMVWPVMVHLETVKSGAGVLTLPFAVTDEMMLDSCQRKGILDMLNAQLEGTGILTLGLLRTADLFFVFKDEEINSPEDLAGLKVRITGGRVLLDTMRKLNVSPISMAASEMSSALSQGVIDGVFTSPSGWADMIGETGQFGYIIPGFSLASYAVLVDRAWYEGLPGPQRNAINASIEGIVADQWQEAIDKDNAKIAGLEDGGAKIHRATEEQMAELKSLVSETAEDFASAHPDAMEAMKSIEVTCGN